jgi:hypothetical protein
VGRWGLSQKGSSGVYWWVKSITRTNEKITVKAGEPIVKLFQ